MSFITALGDRVLPLLGFLPPDTYVLASALIDGVVKSSVDLVLSVRVLFVMDILFSLMECRIARAL